MEWEHNRSLPFLKYQKEIQFTVTASFDENFTHKIDEKTSENFTFIYKYILTPKCCQSKIDIFDT